MGIVIAGLEGILVGGAVTAMLSLTIVLADHLWQRKEDRRRLATVGA